MKSFFQLCLIAVVLAGPGICLGDLHIQGYQTQKHDRFYVGADKEFIGEAFDWSGVGRAGDQWVTMISPTYFLSANHYSPSGDVTFFENNNPSGTSHTYTIDSWSFRCTYGGQDSDLYLGRLTASIPSNHYIAYYPVLGLDSEDDYLGRELYVCGKPNRLGRNILDRIFAGGLSGGNDTRCMEFYYDVPGLGDDECYTQAGDSGAPTFTVCNGALAMLGTHYYGYFSYPSVYSVDSFVPYYVNQLNEHMGSESVTIVPEPATIMMLGLGALGLLRRRRRSSLFSAQ